MEVDSRDEAVRLFIPFFMLPVLLGAKNAPPMWLPLLLVPVLA